MESQIKAVLDRATTPLDAKDGATSEDYQKEETLDDLQQNSSQIIDKMYLLIDLTKGVLTKLKSQNINVENTTGSRSPDRNSKEIENLQRQIDKQYAQHKPLIKQKT